MRRLTKWIAAAVALLAGGALFLPQVASSALPVGAMAPDFTTRGARAGKVFTLTLSHQLKRGPVVLYFFPAAFTPGCSAEAREFAERIDDFGKLGATVIGMSADPVDKLARFSVEECRNRFAVASAGPKVISDYDVALPLIGMTNRTSYVIAPNGRITFVHSAMAHRGHVQAAYDAVKAMQSRR